MEAVVKAVVRRVALAPDYPTPDAGERTRPRRILYRLAAPSLLDGAPRLREVRDVRDDHQRNRRPQERRNERHPEHVQDERHGEQRPRPSRAACPT